MGGIRGYAARAHLPAAGQRCSRLLAKMVSPTGRKDLGEEYSYYGTVNPWLQARPTGSGLLLRVVALVAAWSAAGLWGHSRVLRAASHPYNAV